MQKWSVVALFALLCASAAVADLKADLDNELDSLIRDAAAESDSVEFLDEGVEPEDDLENVSVDEEAAGPAETADLEEDEEAGLEKSNDDAVPLKVETTEDAEVAEGDVEMGPEAVEEPETEDDGSDEQPGEVEDVEDSEEELDEDDADDDEDAEDDDTEDQDETDDVEEEDEKKSDCTVDAKGQARRAGVIKSMAAHSKSEWKIIQKRYLAALKKATALKTMSAFLTKERHRLKNAGNREAGLVRHLKALVKRLDTNHAPEKKEMGNLLEKILARLAKRKYKSTKKFSNAQLNRTNKKLAKANAHLARLKARMNRAGQHVRQVAKVAGIMLKYEAKKCEVEKLKKNCSNSGGAKFDAKAKGVHKKHIKYHHVDSFAAARKANKKYWVRKYDHYEFYKLKVKGKMTNDNIVKTCEEHKLQTPCDHPNYANTGACVVVVKRARHFSYNPHHFFPRHLMKGTYWYTNNGQRVLYNTGTSHRWNNPAKDANGHIMCVLPSKMRKVTYKFKGFRFFRFRVRGQMTNENILSTCEEHKLEPPCDHPSYADGSCVAVMKAAKHLSYNRHHNFPRRFIDRAYFYAGARTFPLMNWRNTHRWAKKGDHDGITFCVAPKAAKNPKNQVRVWKGYKWFKVRVNGQINSAKIAEACENAGLQTPCDHPSYADGHCVAIFKRALHLSYNKHHTFPRRIINGCYFYAGYSRGALQNWKNTHRWSKKGDKHGDTLCVKRVPLKNPGKLVFTKQGFHYYKIRVNGDMSSANIATACKKNKMLTPCDHYSYADGNCVAVFKKARHLSYNKHHFFNRAVMDRCYFYAGFNRRALMNWRNTHRWSKKGDMDGNTLCIRPVKTNPKPVVFTFKGLKFHKVLVKGAMTNDNIFEACKKAGFRTPCDHSSYFDRMCVKVPHFNGKHLSYNRHHTMPRKIVDRCYFYTGHNRKPLQNWRNTHRWARPAGDGWENTLCIE